MGISVFRKRLTERPLISGSKAMSSMRIDVQLKRNLVFRKSLRVKQTIHNRDALVCGRMPEKSRRCIAGDKFIAG